MENNTRTSVQISILKTIDIEYVKAILIFLFGILAVVLHAKLRIPMKLPGHHGLIFMALLFGAKLLSNTKFAGSIFAAGSVSVLLFTSLGFKDPFMPVVIMFPGLITDFLPMLFKTSKLKFWLGVLIGAIAYMSIPLVRIVITTLTGYPYGAFATGFAYPIFTHFLFGAAGTMLAYSINLGIKKIKE